MKRKSAYTFGARRNPAEILVLSNPHKRGKKAVRKHGFRFRARSNPLPIIGTAVPTIKVAGMGALGALANDALMARIRPMLPAAVSGDYAVAGLKVVTALALGMVADKVKAGTGRTLAIGGVTCALHDAARAAITARFPTLLGEYVNDVEGGDMDGYPANSAHGYPGGGNVLAQSGSVARPLAEYVSDTGYDN